MQDNIRVNAPIPQTDVTGRVRPAKESPPELNPVDVARVNPRNASENSQGAKNDSNAYNYLLNRDSVFNKFIQQLSSTPGLEQTLKKIMYDIFAQDGKSARSIVKDSTIDGLLEKLASSLKMSPEEIVAALSYQSDNQTKFGGGVFDMLRELFKQAKTSQEFESLLGHFLKAYNGYKSTGDTLNAIVHNLQSIADNMPKSYAVKLQDIIAKLITSQPEASLDINLATLKAEVIPFLSDYISGTNDFGKVRDFVTLLINNIARLNTSSRDDLLAKFVDLLDFCKFNFDMPDDVLLQIKNAFVAEMSAQQKPQNEMFETIAELLQAGDKSEVQSAAAKAIFRDITSALLLDNSVFMPLTHIFLPVNYQGAFMFTELWIDKDADPKSPEKRALGERCIKVFVTFDIKGLGFFEATVWLGKDNSADVDLSYPDDLAMPERDIRNNIAQIIAKNGFSLSSVSLEKGQPPKPLRAVFESLTANRRGIDVTI